MNLVLFGPPGAGKGTQARLLAERCNLEHICTGDLLRDEVKQETPLGNQIKEIMDQGRYPSDEIILKVFRTKLESVKGRGLVLDGIPRTMNQVHEIEHIFIELGLELDAVIQLQVNDEALIQRLSSRVICKVCGAPYTRDSENAQPKECTNCGSSSFIRRPDDEPEAVKTRLDVYNQQTKPLIDYYKEKKKLSFVDGMKSVNEVFQQIQSVLRKMQILTSEPGCLYSAQDV